MEHLELIQQRVQASIAVKQATLENQDLLSRIGVSADLITKCLQQDGKILFCGNGGSAADAQHLAAELSGRFYQDREPLFAEALRVNTSYITAVANDYSYDEVYSRLIKAKGRKGDVLVAISTSGNSNNILKALECARESQMICIGLSGESGGKMAALCDVLLNVPSDDTPRIQEVHILIGHIICELVERTYF